MFIMWNTVFTADTKAWKLEKRWFFRQWYFSALLRAPVFSFLRSELTLLASPWLTVHLITQYFLSQKEIGLLFASAVGDILGQAHPWPPHAIASQLCLCNHCLSACSVISSPKSEHTYGKFQFVDGFIVIISGGASKSKWAEPMPYWWPESVEFVPPSRTRGEFKSLVHHEKLFCPYEWFSPRFRSLISYSSCWFEPRLTLGNEWNIRNNKVQ